MVSEIPVGPLLERLEKCQVPHSLINTPMDLFQDPICGAQESPPESRDRARPRRNCPPCHMVFDSQPKQHSPAASKLGQHTEGDHGGGGFSPEADRGDERAE